MMEPFNGMTVADTVHLRGGARPLSVIIARGGVAYIHDMDEGYNVVVEEGGELHALPCHGGSGVIINKGGVVVNDGERLVIQDDGDTTTRGGELRASHGTVYASDAYIDARGDATVYAQRCVGVQRYRSTVDHDEDSTIRKVTFQWRRHDQN